MYVLMQARARYRARSGISLLHAPPSTGSVVLAELASELIPGDTQAQLFDTQAQRTAFV